MATITKKKKVQRPLLDQKGLKAEEEALRKKYKGTVMIVPGSLRNRGDDPDHNKLYKNKRTVVIKCKKRGCQNTRRIATSDIHQVQFCETCTIRDRMDRKNSARRKSE